MFEEKKKLTFLIANNFFLLIFSYQSDQWTSPLHQKIVSFFLISFHIIFGVKMSKMNIKSDLILLFSLENLSFSAYLHL